MRQLYVVPIIHSKEDLGKLRDVATTVKSKFLSASRMQAATAAVSVFWEELLNAIQDWDMDWCTAQIYQDALPYTDVENASLIKLIVDDLASQGSQNHKILQWMEAQGAVIQGSELPALLVEEYRLIKESMELAASRDARTERIAELAGMQAEVLQKRDTFIAERIDKTLTERGIGIIFLGILHSLEAKLPPDISVSYPFGKPIRVAIA